jgi:hypothetical protein
LEVLILSVLKLKEQLYARLYKPELDKVNKAAIVFCHGAGYLANAQLLE